MAFERDFLTMMPHVLELEPYTGFDVHGDPLPFGSVRRYQCLITGKDISLRRQSSEQDAIIFDIYIGARIVGGMKRPVTDDLITLNDRITLPPGQEWRDRNPIIFAVGHLSDDDGNHHIKLQCGWMYHRQGQ